jgi:cytochrome c biogenesis factor
MFKRGVKMLFYGAELPRVSFIIIYILVFILSYAYIEPLFKLYFALKLLSLKPEVTQNQWIANFKSKIILLNILIIIFFVIELLNLNLPKAILNLKFEKLKIWWKFYLVTLIVILFFLALTFVGFLFSDFKQLLSISPLFYISFLIIVAFYLFIQRFFLSLSFYPSFAKYSIPTAYKLFKLFQK